MNRARIIEMAKEADPEWLLPHPDVCADEVAALERFAALVLAQAMEPAGSGAGHSTARSGEPTTGQPQQASRRELDMAMLIRMLCSHTAGPKTRERAMAYLVREGLQGSPLRAAHPVDKAAEMQGASVDKSANLQDSERDPDELVRSMVNAAMKGDRNG